MALKHGVGRELCYDMFFLLGKNIEAIPDTAEGRDALTLMMSDIAILKKVLRRVCRIIIQHEKVKHEDGRDFFSMSEWKTLYAKVVAERFVKERGAIEKGRSFATAYRTPMGEAVEEHMLSSIQKGYVSIDKGDMTVDGLYEMNVYRTITQLWDKRILDYKTNINRVKKIIYKEN